MLRWQILVRWQTGNLELNPHIQESYEDAMKQASRIWKMEDPGIRLYYLKWDISKINDIPELWDIHVSYLEEQEDEET